MKNFKKTALILVIVVVTSTASLYQAFGNKSVRVVPSPSPSSSPAPTLSGTPSAGGCYVGGCSAQICSDQPNVVSTCEYTAAYSCYKKTSRCERQASGQCGWTQTPELVACLANPSATK